MYIYLYCLLYTKKFPTTALYRARAAATANLLHRRPDGNAFLPFLPLVIRHQRGEDTFKRKKVSDHDARRLQSGRLLLVLAIRGNVNSLLMWSVGGGKTET